jgi:hypothetical protein
MIWRCCGNTLLRLSQRSNNAKRLDCGAFTAAVARDWSSLPRGQFSAAWHWQAGFAEGQRNGGSLAK